MFTKLTLVNLFFFSNFTFLRNLDKIEFLNVRFNFMTKFHQKNYKFEVI